MLALLVLLASPRVIEATVFTKSFAFGKYFSVRGWS